MRPCLDKSFASFERRSFATPYFSVCIPQYNRTHFLIEALKSLDQQVFRDFEVCISDDCSTDRQEQVLFDYLEQSRLSFIYRQRQQNGRYDANLRDSLALSQGKYCFLLGNDDGLASPTVLAEVQREIERAGPIAVAFTNYEESSGKPVRRVKSTGLIGSGPGVGASYFRDFSFVSGVILDAAGARRLSTKRWDGSEMYQMYLGCCLLAEGGKLLGIDQITIQKDLQVAGQAVDNYARKPRIAPCPIVERQLPLNQVGQLVVDGLSRGGSRGLDDLAERVLFQLFAFTFPYWIVEYKRVQSLKYALGVCLGLRPTNVWGGLPLPWYRKLRLGSVYVLAMSAAILVPVRWFGMFQTSLRRISKGRVSK